MCSAPFQLEVMLLAQIDVISGGAGWLGAGLLGVVLGWLLMIHLPAKDKLIKDIIDGHNSRVDNLIVIHANEIRMQRTEYVDTLNKVIINCNNETKELRDIFLRDMPILAESIVQTLNKGIKQ